MKLPAGKQELIKRKLQNCGAARNVDKPGYLIPMARTAALLEGTYLSNAMAAGLCTQSGKSPKFKEFFLKSVEEA